GDGSPPAISPTRAHSRVAGARGRRLRLLPGLIESQRTLRRCRARAAHADTRRAPGGLPPRQGTQALVSRGNGATEPAGENVAGEATPAQSEGEGQRQHQSAERDPEGDQ